MVRPSVRRGALVKQIPDSVLRWIDGSYSTVYGTVHGFRRKVTWVKGVIYHACCSHALHPHCLPHRSKTLLLTYTPYTRLFPAHQTNSYLFHIVPCKKTKRTKKRRSTKKFFYIKTRATRSLGRRHFNFFSVPFRITSCYLVRGPPSVYDPWDGMGMGMGMEERALR